MAGSNENMTEMLIEAIDGLQAARYTSAAATTIYLYNIFLTLDLEIEYIWKRLSFNLPTLLYMTNRYVGLGFFLLVMWDIAGFHGDLPDEYCKTPVDFIGFTLAHLVWICIMTLRVCALWRQNKALVRLIYVLWICTMAALVIIGVLAYREVHDTMAYNVYIRICAPTVVPNLLKVQPIAPVIYELFLTALTLIKALDFRALPSFPSIYHVLARDGVIYFVVSGTISAVNVIAWYCLPNSQLYLLLCIYVATMSTFLAQMSLNLKAALVHEKLGLTEDITTAAFESPSHPRVRSYISRGQRDLETIESVPESIVEDERDEAYNAQSSQVPQTPRSLPLKRMDSKQTGWSDGEYAETLPSNASDLSQRGSGCSPPVHYACI